MTAYGFIAAMFYFVVSIVLFLYGLIFYMRAIIIWLLIIIAPIAFVSAVFRTKETKAIFVGPLNWDTWWEWLLQWSFMGMALAFWLALAINVSQLPLTRTDIQQEIDQGRIKNTIVTSPPKANPGEMAMEKNTVNLFVNILQYLIPVIILWVGVTTSPGLMGEMTSKAYRATRKYAGRVAAGAATGATAAGIAGFREGFKKQWMKRKTGIGKKPGLGRIVKSGGEFFLGLGRGLGRGLARAPRGGFGEGLTAIGKPIPEEIKEEAVPLWAQRAFVATKKQAREYIKRVYEEEGPEKVKEIAESKIYPQARVVREAALEKLIEENKISQDIIDKAKGLLLSVYTEASLRGETGKTAAIERMALRLAEEFGKIARSTGAYTAEEAEKDKDKGIDNYTKKIIAKVKTAEDVKQLQRGWWDINDAMEAAQKFWTGAQWGAAGRHFGKEIIDSLQPTISALQRFRDTNNRAAYLHFVWDRPGLARFSETAAAQELGFHSFYELAPERVKREFKNIKEVLAEKP
jgi:hypothetical protein